MWSSLIFRTNTYSGVSPEVKTHGSGGRYNQHDYQGRKRIYGVEVLVPAADAAILIGGDAAAEPGVPEAKRGTSGFRPGPTFKPLSHIKPGYVWLSFPFRSSNDDNCEGANG